MINAKNFRESPIRTGASGLLVLISLFLNSCTALQLQGTTLAQTATLEQIRFDQLLTNVSNEISRPDSILSLSVTNTGSAQVSESGMITIPISRVSGKTTRGITPQISTNMQNSWSINPIADPQDLNNLRALFGLLYKTDYEIAKIIYETEQQLERKVANPKCGLSWAGELTDKPKILINEPNHALIAYFIAVGAFPYPPSTKTEDSYYDCYAEKTIGPAQAPTSPARRTKENQLAARTGSADLSKLPNGANARTEPQEVQTTAVSVDGAIQRGQTAQLNAVYGLSYPTPLQVLRALRNGLSPGCRHYQLFHLGVKGRNKPSALFERWLFWKDSHGAWGPYTPPDGEASLESLGHYGNHDFWTPASACVSDFIVLAINSAANSHAAAQAREFSE